MRAMARLVHATALTMALVMPARSAQAPPPILRPAIPMQMPPFRTPLVGTYAYVAIPMSAPPARLGTVQAGGIAWTCDKAACRTTGPWPQPGVAACAALAKEIGPIRSYGRKGVELTPDQLNQCNRSATAASTTTTEEAPPKGLAPKPPEEAPAPPPPAEAAAAPAPSGVRIDVAELSLVGGAQGSAAASAVSAIAITSTELSVVGGAQGSRPGAASTIAITVPELSVIGR